eukprot:g76522.t1
MMVPRFSTQNLVNVPGTGASQNKMQFDYVALERPSQPLSPRRILPLMAALTGAALTCLSGFVTTPFSSPRTPAGGAATPAYSVLPFSFSSYYHSPVNSGSAGGGSGMDDVVVRPGPISPLGLLSRHKLMSSHVFIYPGQKWPPSLEQGAIQTEEGYILGAIPHDKGLATITGRPEDQLKGTVLTFNTLNDIAAKLEVLDKYLGYDDSKPHEVLRSI